MGTSPIHQHVQRELNHIPKWPKPQQSELRMVYNALRLARENRQETRGEILRESINLLRPDHPAFEFQYDQAVFAAL